jgi:AcrR family transcriptional regulator
MPKIDAPTVAEHHLRRRAALIAAATELLAAGGLEAVTLASVGAAAGLARSSVYQYFDSTAALLAAVVEDVMPRATERLVAAMQQVAEPAARVDAFVTVTLEAAVDPTHRSVRALERSTIPAPCLARIAELHQEQYRPLRAALVELGVPDPGLSVRLVLGLVAAAAHAIGDGAAQDEVLGRTLELLHHGIGGSVRTATVLGP